MITIIIIIIKIAPQIGIITTLHKFLVVTGRKKCINIHKALIYETVSPVACGISHALL